MAATGKGGRPSSKRTSLLQAGIAPQRRSNSESAKQRPSTTGQISSLRAGSTAQHKPHVKGFAANVITVESPDCIMPSQSASSRLTKQLQTLVHATLPSTQLQGAQGARPWRPWTAPDALEQQTGSSSSAACNPFSAETPRPHTADSWGLSAVVAQHNQKLQKALGATESRAVNNLSKHGEYHAPAQRLDAMSEQIQELDACLEGALSNHSRFLSARTPRSDEKTEHERRRPHTVPAKSLASTAEAGFQTAGYPQASAGSHHAAAQPSEPALNQGAGDIDAEEQAEDDGKNTRPPRIMRTNTRAQALAKSHFGDVDLGNSSRAGVFQTVTCPPRRVEVKVDFFRERRHLLPRNLNEYMHIDAKTGEKAVDISKLHARPLFKLNIHNEEELMKLGRDWWREEIDVVRESTSDHMNSIQSSLSAVESVQQRSERLRKQGQVRDQHISEVREAARSKVLAKRHVQLHALQRKDNRKDVTKRERDALQWMTIAIATETLARLWQNFVHLQDPTVAKKSKWKNVVSAKFTHSNLVGKELMPSAQKLLTLTLQRRALAQDRTERSRSASLRWWTIIRCARFVAKLLLRRRCNLNAEMIKDVINVYWRGYQLRASMKMYLHQMRFLQFAMRSCVKMRTHIRQQIYLPMLWEVETTILADVIAMPKAALEVEIEKHRAIWDIKARCQEVRIMSDVRTSWQAHMQVTSAMKMDQKCLTAERRCSFTGMRYSLSQATPAILAPRHHGRHKATFVEDERGRRATHPLMEVIDKYRLSTELRQSIAKKCLLMSIDRWWVRYQDYKVQTEDFKTLWQQWRLDVGALGPLNRHVWPMCPAIPRFPSELVKVDEKWLHSQVVTALRQTQAGQLL